MVPHQQPSPSDVNTDEAIAMLPEGSRVKVVQVHAQSGKADMPYVWHRDFAADKLRHKGAKRTYDQQYAAFGVYFVDENGDTFYVETKPAEAPEQAEQPTDG